MYCLQVYRRTLCTLVKLIFDFCSVNLQNLIFASFPHLHQSYNNKNITWLLTAIRAVGKYLTCYWIHLPEQPNSRTASVHFRILFGKQSHQLTTSIRSGRKANKVKFNNRRIQTIFKFPPMMDTTIDIQIPNNNCGIKQSLPNNKLVIYHSTQFDIVMRFDNLEDT